MKLKCFTIFLPVIKLRTENEIKCALKRKKHVARFNIGDNGVFAPSLEHFQHPVFGRIFRWRRYSGWWFGQRLERKLWRDIHNARLRYKLT